MAFNFNVRKITPLSLEISSFAFKVKTITPIPDEPTEELRLKDSNNNYILDSENNKLFVRR